MKILIDAGHGGTDSGAIGSMAYYGGNPETVYEKNLTLSLAEAVKYYLEYGLNATVYMSRSTDTYVSINNRSKVAHDSDVDAVLSIHFNSSGTGTARGVETFYAATREDDYYFAKAIQDSVVASFNPTTRGVKDDSLSAVGSLGILRNYSSDSYPRALIEVEFIDNETAMSSLLGYEYSERIYDFAAAIKEAFSNYFGVSTTRSNSELKSEYMKSVANNK